MYQVSSLNMKVFLVLTVCLFAVSANSVLELKNGSSDVKLTVRQCITSYNIDPAVVEVENDKNMGLYDKLSGDQQGCVTACIYKGFNWLKPDGTLDVEALFEDDNSGEEDNERKKYEKAIEECRAESGKDDCKFFHCLEMKE